MNQSSSHKWTFKRIVLHLLFWLFYVLFFGLFYGKYGHDYRLHLTETALMMPFVMLATYTTIYLILPYYLQTKRLFFTVSIVVVLLLAVTLGERIYLRWLNDLPITFDTLFGVTFLYLMLETNFMVGLGFTVKFVKKWFEQQQEKHEVEKMHLESELNVLKGQLHPHFLFNTMNNLYALSLEKSSKTSEGIAKMSDLLRSVLYECNELEIELDNEINLIRNYIDLEKMRYGDRLKVNFEVIGLTAKKRIAPMMLFTFVENSFKHGSSNDHENPFIDIKLKVNTNELIFKVQNSKPKSIGSNSDRKEGGIGLANVKKRLEIIYKGKYDLKCGNEDCRYHVVLKIKT